MLIEGGPSKITDQSESLYDGAKQVAWNEVFLTHSHLVPLPALLHDQFPNTLSRIAVSESEFDESMAAFKENSVDIFQRELFELITRECGNEVIDFATKDGRDD
jgi:hypothetical protein